MYSFYCLLGFEFLLIILVYREIIRKLLFCSEDFESYSIGKWLLLVLKPMSFLISTEPNMLTLSRVSKTSHKSLETRTCCNYWLAIAFVLIY